MYRVEYIIKTREKLWTINCCINNTIYDSLVQLSRTLKGNDREIFLENVIQKRLYFKNGKQVPMKQPLKKIFNLKSSESFTIFAQ